MSDRRPEMWMPCEHGMLHEHFWNYPPGKGEQCSGGRWAESADLLAAIRRGVESGTIKPDYEAAKEALRDTPGVTLLLSRILELAGMPMERVMEKDLGGFARMLEDHVLRSRKVREAVDVALGGPVSDGGSET